MCEKRALTGIDWAANNYHPTGLSNPINALSDGFELEHLNILFLEHLKQHNVLLVYLSLTENPMVSNVL